MAVHKMPDIYGEDVDAFEPERWLTEDLDRLKLMRYFFMGFAMGTRACIGQT
jgi:cytochrome P450